MTDNLPAKQTSNAVSNPALTADSIKQQVVLIQDVMKKVMKKGEHYGTIPGCGPKPTLLKPGAEKLNMTFRLAPSFKIETNRFDKGHVQETVVTTLTHIDTGLVISEGVGSCSTMEKKYRNNAPPDVYNTVLKMAKKRSLVDATLTATAASDIFTQDIEDKSGGNGNGKPDVYDIAVAACRACEDMPQLTAHFDQWARITESWTGDWAKKWKAECTAQKEKVNATPAEQAGESPE